MKNEFIYCGDAGSGFSNIRLFHALGGKAFVVTQAAHELPDSMKARIMDDQNYRLLSDNKGTVLSCLKSCDHQDKADHSFDTDRAYKVISGDSLIIPGLSDDKSAAFGKQKKDKKAMTYYDYLKYEWRVPWWEDLFGLSSPKPQKDTLVNTFELTIEQARIADLAIKNVQCKIDKKTGLITIDVKAQDAHVVAQLADSVKNRLQDFLTAYRTKKARHDLEFALKLNKQAKKDYERARLLYSEYMDANQDVTLLTAQQKQNDLENEMQLQYNNFTATSAQVLTAKALVQKETPSFTTIQSATVPLGPSGPKIPLITLVCLFLAALGTTIYALYKEHQLKPLLGLS